MRIRTLLVLFSVALLAGCATGEQGLRHPALGVYYAAADDADPSWAFEVDMRGRAIQRVQYQNHEDWQVRRGKVSQVILASLLNQAAKLKYEVGGHDELPIFLVARYEGKQSTTLIYRGGQPSCDPQAVAALRVFFQTVVSTLPEPVKNQALPDCAANKGEAVPASVAPN